MASLPKKPMPTNVFGGTRIVKPPPFAALPPSRPISQQIRYTQTPEISLEKYEKKIQTRPPPPPIEISSSESESEESEEEYVQKPPPIPEPSEPGLKTSFRPPSPISKTSKDLYFQSKLGDVYASFLEKLRILDIQLPFLEYERNSSFGLLIPRSENEISECFRNIYFIRLIEVVGRIVGSEKIENDPKVFVEHLFFFSIMILEIEYLRKRSQYDISTPIEIVKYIGLTIHSISNIIIPLSEAIRTERIDERLSLMKKYASFLLSLFTSTDIQSSLIGVSKEHLYGVSPYSEDLHFFDILNEIAGGIELSKSLNNSLSFNIKTKFALDSPAFDVLKLSRTSLFRSIILKLQDYDDFRKKPNMELPSLAELLKMKTKPTIKTFQLEEISIMLNMLSIHLRTDLD